MHLHITIPQGAECLIKSGEEVEFDTPFIKINQSVELAIPVASRLGITPDKIFHHLKKFVGEKIEKGELLATKKGMLTTAKVTSDYEGIIKEVDHVHGNIIIKTNTEEKNVINSHFKGHIVEIEKDVIKLKVHKGEEFSLKKASQSFGGEVHYLKDDALNSTITASDIENKVIVAESINSYVESKYEALGGKAFVTLHNTADTHTSPYAQLKNIEDYKKIHHLQYSYCLIDSDSSRIYFYQ